jgi:hypothetical protein
MERELLMKATLVMRPHSAKPNTPPILKHDFNFASNAGNPGTMYRRSLRAQINCPSRGDSEPGRLRPNPRVLRMDEIDLVVDHHAHQDLGAEPTRKSPPRRSLAAAV